MSKGNNPIFESKKDEIYYNIGKFVVEFEIMLKEISENLVEFLDQQSTFIETEYLESLISELDAMGLIIKFHNLYEIKYRDNKQNSDLIKKIFQRLKLIVEFRNALIHNAWNFYEDEPSTKELRKISTIIDTYMISNKARKRAAKHITYTSTISLEVIKIYIDELTNMRAIFIKLSKYNNKDSDKVIIIQKNNLRRLEREVKRVIPKALDEIWKSALNFVNKKN